MKIFIKNNGQFFKRSFLDIFFCSKESKISNYLVYSCYLFCGFCGNSSKNSYSRAEFLHSCSIQKNINRLVRLRAIKSFDVVFSLQFFSILCTQCLSLFVIKEGEEEFFSFISGSNGLNLQSFPVLLFSHTFRY